MHKGLHGIPRADYAFTITSREGAILTLLDGAQKFELGDEKKLRQIREHVKKYALQRRRFAAKDTI